VVVERTHKVGLQAAGHRDHPHRVLLEQAQNSPPRARRTPAPLRPDAAPTCPARPCAPVYLPVPVSDGRQLPGYYRARW
jgi:hypothetical protein